MVKLRFMLGYSDTKACALNHCAIPPLPTENGQTHWRPALGQRSGALGLYFDSRFPSISVKSSPREDECPGPIHSCLPFFSYNPELPSCLILQAWVGTDHGPLSRASRMQRTRSSEFCLCYQRGLPMAYIFHLWKFLDKVPG